MGPYTVQSATEITVTVDKENVAIPVSLDGMPSVPRVCSNMELTEGIHNTNGQPELTALFVFTMSFCVPSGYAKKE